VLEFFLVRVSVWLACIAWFTGSGCRLLATNNEPESPGSQANAISCRSLYGWSWLAGACLSLIHIAASYGFVYHWSHAAAIEATAIDSFQTTGVRAGWGVYVNFLFAAIWLSYSVAILTGKERIRTVDVSVYVFTAAILACATILFEAGIIRYLAAVGFLALFGFHLRFRTL
jgi:hypothetical protein